MGKWRPWRCKDCKSTTPPISARGLCLDCAIARQRKSAVQQSARSGPYYDNWAKRMTELMPSKAHKFR